MKELQLTILLAILCLNSIFSQQRPQNAGELAEIYSNYFSLNREAVYLHLNKTTVAPEENIWFTAYAYSPQFYLPNITTNLHVNLYNSAGQLLEAKTILLESGQGEGHFQLDPDKYTSGEYLIRASTRYMDNFREDASFTQEFRIIGKTDAPSAQRQYDLQLLPEGGHLVADIDNSLGVKLIDHTGAGVVFTEGLVLNAQKEVVNKFKSNLFGLSKFRFVPVAGEIYTVRVKLEDGNNLEVPVPQPEATGISFTTTWLRDQVLFTFKTNEKTYEFLKDQNFLFAFHKDGAMKALNFVFSEVDKSANLTLNEDALFTGINTITVFNENQEPILERLIFNRDSISRSHISANMGIGETDSLVVSLKGPNDIGEHSLSVSVLPAETVSYQPDNNIFSAFYIEPYIKGNLENGAYYFSEEVEPRRRDYDLDLLLLTQGWSKYSWDDIFNNTPKEEYAHEHGFTLKGNVLKRNPKTDKRLFIGSTTDNLSVIADLAEDGSFVSQNLFIQDSARVTFGIMNEKNNKMSEPGINATLHPARDKKNLDPSDTYSVAFSRNIKEADEGMADSNQIADDFILGVEMLETVFLESKVLTEEAKHLEQERELNRGDMYGRTDLLTEEEAARMPSIFPLLQEKGFEARGNNVYTRRELMRKPSGTSMGLPAQPTLVLIDGLQSSVSDLQFLRTMDIKSIYTNKLGMGRRTYGKGGETGGGLIEIVTRNPYSSGTKPPQTTLVENGFSPTKEFYAPRYKSYTSSSFKNYGVLAWFPKVQLENGKIDLKIFNTMQASQKLYVEGMTADGALISEEIVLKSK